MVWFARLLSRIAGGQNRQAGRAERLITLTASLENQPDALANWVLRGELYLEIGEYALAAADFQQALTLADALFEQERWGIVTQALRDRAIAGLQQAIERRNAL
jgi:tetratricopeptide (TPR) repeat protein